MEFKGEIHSLNYTYYERKQALKTNYINQQPWKWKKRKDFQRRLSSNPLYSSDVWPQMAKKQQQRNKQTKNQTNKKTKTNKENSHWCELQTGSFDREIFKRDGRSDQVTQYCQFWRFGQGLESTGKKNCVTSRSQGTDRYELYCYKEMSSSLEFFERNEELWISWL